MSGMILAWMCGLYLKMKLQGQSRFSTSLNGDSFFTSNAEWSSLTWSDAGGGAIAVTGTGSLTIQNCKFTSIVNQKDSGGAISTAVDTVIEGSSFRNCKSSVQGAALYVTKGTNNLRVEFSTFNDCYTKYGGTIYLDVGRNLPALTVRSCVFQGATAYYSHAGGVSMELYINSIVTNLVFDNNTFCTASVSCNCYSLVGIHLGADRSALIQNCVFKGYEGGKARVGKFLVLVPYSGTTLVYRNCTWESLSQYLWNPTWTLDVTGVVPDGLIDRVTVEFCTFKNLTSVYTSPAMYTHNCKTLTVKLCTFEKCGILNRPLFESLSSH